MHNAPAPTPSPNLDAFPVDFLFGLEYSKQYVMACDAAATSILSITYRLGPLVHKTNNPFADVLAALERAAARKVKVLLYFCPHGLPKLQRTPHNTLLSRLGDAHIRLRQSDFNVRLHAKLAIFDDTFCLIGSHNLTHASLKSNAEISAAFHVPHSPKRLQQWLHMLTVPTNAQVH